MVVTIVVLLILAGISISLITGENGLIQRTIGVKDAHDIAKIKEELQLAIHALEVDYHTGNEQGTFRDYIFSTAQGKGQEKLKAELGESNLSFDSPSHKITYKGVVFNVLGNGDIIIDGNGQGGTGQTDWDEIMRTAQKHPDQRDSEDIGIDAFGNPVNLDLWVYSGTALEDANSDGSYGYCEECQMPCNHSWRNDGYCDICGYYDESHDNGN